MAWTVAGTRVGINEYELHDHRPDTVLISRLIHKSLDIESQLRNYPHALQRMKYKHIKALRQLLTVRAVTFSAAAIS